MDMCLAFMRKDGGWGGWGVGQWGWEGGGVGSEKLWARAGSVGTANQGEAFRHEKKEPTSWPPARSHFQGQHTEN